MISDRAPEDKDVQEAHHFAISNRCVLRCMILGQIINACGDSTGFGFVDILHGKLNDTLWIENSVSFGLGETLKGCTQVRTRLFIVREFTCSSARKPSRTWIRSASLASALSLADFGSQSL